MKAGRIVLIMIFALFMNLLFFDNGLTQMKEARETIFISGIVRDIAWDHKSIVVDGKKFFISNDTGVVDQKGNRLKIGDVKTNSDVAIDAIQNPNGYMIKKIVVILDKGV